MIRVYIALLLFQTMSETRENHLEEGKGSYIWSRYLRDKLQFGTVWKVYIPAMTYHILHSSIHQERLSSHRPHETLIDLIRKFPSILSERHPCQHGTFLVYGRQFGKQFFAQHADQSVYFLPTDYRICGVYNFTYDPGYYIGESSRALSDRNLPCADDKPLSISWNLHAGEDFGINFTLSEFTAPRAHGCADARVIMKKEKMVLFEICPKLGKWNYVAKDVTFIFVLHYYQNPLYIEKRDQKYTKLSFYYQILDYRKVSLMYTAGAPRRKLVKLGMEHTLHFESFSGTFLNGSNPRLEHVLKLPHASVYAFAIHISDFHDFLTPVIYRNKFTCNIPEAEAIFYDGPVQTPWHPALPILTYWSCLQNTSNYTATNLDSEEVRGSVGELNIIFFVPKKEGNNFTHLEITWQAQRLLSSYLQIREVDLNFSESTRIDFHPVTTTLLDVVYIQAPDTKFIQLSFTDMNYVVSTEVHSNVYSDRCLDGFEIRGERTKETICFNSTAENVLNHYKTDGLVVGRNITLIRKQYGWLLPLSAVIIARSHSCVGYVNEFPTWTNMFSWYRIPQAIVFFSVTNDYFRNGSFAGNSKLRIFFKCLSQACCKLQIFPSSDLEFYTLSLYSLQYKYLIYTITSENLTSPLDFVIDFASIGKMVEFQNVSSVYGLRVYSLNNRCRLARHASPYTGIWDTEAYSAQIGFHSSTLRHAVGFSIKVGQGRKLPVCTDESHTNVTDMLFDVNLAGPCANSDLNAEAIRFVSIYKTHRNRSCCRFDGYIVILSMVGHAGLSLQELRKKKGHIYNYWDVSYRDTNVKFWLLCAHLCLEIIIELYLDRSSLKTVSVGYQAKLIEQDNLYGVTFAQTPFPLGFKSPRLGLNTWNKVCLNHSCYITPRNNKVSTWDQAKTACEEKGANLVSINSDLEWALLTRLPLQKEEEFIELYNIRDVILIYIGLVTDVSTNSPR